MKKRLYWLNWFDTIFNRMVFSFVVLVVVVSLITGVVLTVQFSVNYNKKIEELENYRISYLKNNVETIFKDSNQAILDIMNLSNQNDDIHEYLYYPMEKDKLKAVNILEFIKVICTQRDSTFSSIELYTVQNNVHISTLTGINFSSYTKESITNGEIFKQETEYQNSNRWISHRIITFGNEEYPVYTFAAKYPLYTKDPNMVKGYVVVNIKEEVFHRFLRDFISRELDAVAIMNKQGEIIAVEGNKEGFYTFLNEKEKLIDTIIADADKSKKYIEKDMVITSQSAGIEDWILINMVSTKEYFDETRKIQLNIIYYSCAIIIIGIIISYGFARKLYRPFHLIINKLDNMKFSKKARESEHYYIDRAIEELCDRAKEKEEILYDNRNIIKRDFVLNLLSAKITNDEEIEKKLALLGCNIPYNNHNILIIKLHQKLYDSLDEMTRNVLIYNMIYFLDNCSCNSTRCLSADLFDGSVCAIFSSVDDCSKELAMLRKKFISYMKINFSVDIIILQSLSFASLTEVYSSYQRVEKIINYLYFIPHVYFIDEEELKDKISSVKETMEIDFESFSEALLSRDISKVDIILKNFLYESARFTTSSEYLNGAILKFVFLFNHFTRDILKESKNKNDTQIFKDINELYNVEDFYFWFMKLIDTAFHQLSDLEENPTKTVVLLIENVIMDNLAENLSLEFIAEKVYLSPKYISRIFKEETGINITQFITECKLKKAAKLLVESNISLEELIIQIGFSSSNYFIKKFKEKYAITPVQYRRNAIDTGR